MDVHEVVHYTALDMVLNLVHKISGAHIEDLNVGHVPNAYKIGKWKTEWIEIQGKFVLPVVSYNM